MEYRTYFMFLPSFPPWVKKNANLIEKFLTEAWASVPVRFNITRGPELHLEMSSQQEPFLLLDVSTLRCLSCICAGPGLVYTTKTLYLDVYGVDKEASACLAMHVYTIGAWVVSGRVYTTEAFTAPGRVYVTGDWAAPGLTVDVS
jgi:hypothetical protein